MLGSPRQCSSCGPMALPPKWARAILSLFMISVFMAILLLTSKQASQVCYGSSCDFNLREFLSKSHSNRVGSDRHSGKTSNDECDFFPDTSNVLLLIKTGASEAYSRLPTHLLTTLKCLRGHFLLFSDMSENLAGHAVHDSLETVIDTVKQSNADFEIYHRQKHCPIAHQQCNHAYDVGVEGWNLDKYKNVHIAEKAFTMRPHYDWYFFVDADTYVSFPTLMEWLRTVDPNKPHYIGHVKYSGSFPFAHGGSGYIMSKAVMRSLFLDKSGVARKYDEPVQFNCCGDIMWSEIVLNETGLSPENMWPAMNENKPRTFSYYDEQWCQPLITMHHVSAQEINDLYAFERDRKFAPKVKIKDVYDSFVAPHLQDVQADWDNGSEDVHYLDLETGGYEESVLQRAKVDGLSNTERDAHRTFANCKTACFAQEECFQWRYQNGICSMNFKLKHGEPVKRDDLNQRRTFSGWNMRKIEGWTKEQGDCLERHEWRIEDLQ